MGSAMTSITDGTVFVCSELFIFLCAAIKSWLKLTDGLALGMSSSRGSKSRSAFHAAIPPRWWAFHGLPGGGKLRGVGVPSD